MNIFQETMSYKLTYLCVETWRKGLELYGEEKVKGEAAS